MDAPARTIEIAPYAERDRAGVLDLILPIQQAEFGLPVTLRAQPDLLDIAACYRRGCGNFWVAAAGREVVGTIALLDIGNGDAALRKMFVAARFRGAEHGVGQRLLEELLRWSGTRGLRRIYLGTTEAAAFPVMSLDTRYYERALTT